MGVLKDSIISYASHHMHARARTRIFAPLFADTGQTESLYQHQASHSRSQLDACWPVALAAATAFSMCMWDVGGRAMVMDGRGEVRTKDKVGPPLTANRLKGEVYCLRADLLCTALGLGGRVPYGTVWCYVAPHWVGYSMVRCCYVLPYGGRVQCSTICGSYGYMASRTRKRGGSERKYTPQAPSMYRQPDNSNRATRSSTERLRKAPNPQPNPDASALPQGSLPATALICPLSSVIDWDPLVALLATQAQTAVNNSPPSLTPEPHNFPLAPYTFQQLPTHQADVHVTPPTHRSEAPTQPCEQLTLYHAVDVTISQQQAAPSLP